MEEIKKQTEVLFDGFFYFFGFIENPAEKPAKQTIKDSPSNKIKADLKRINKDCRDSYLHLRNEVLSIGE